LSGWMQLLSTVRLFTSTSSGSEASSLLSGVDLGVSASAVPSMPFVFHRFPMRMLRDAGIGLRVGGSNHPSLIRDSGQESARKARRAADVPAAISLERGT